MMISYRSIVKNSVGCLLLLNWLMQETPRSVPIGVVLVSSYRTTLLQQLTQHWDCRTVIYPWHHHRPPLEYGQRKIQTNNWIYFAEAPPIKICTGYWVISSLLHQYYIRLVGFSLSKHLCYCYCLLINKIYIYMYYIIVWIMKATYVP